jgi:hypothetical protein
LLGRSPTASTPPSAMAKMTTMTSTSCGIRTIPAAWIYHLRIH